MSYFKESKAKKYIRVYAWLSLVSGILLAIIIIATMQTTIEGYTMTYDKPEPMRWLYAFVVVLISAFQSAFMFGFADLIDFTEQSRDIQSETKREIVKIREEIEKGS